MFALGSIHLYYMFFGNAFSPRDAELETRIKAVSPLLTREISMRNVSVGFNASHGLSAMLFGAIYGYLEIAQPAALFGSSFLLALGFAFLVALLALASVYWFAPRSGESLSPLRPIQLRCACAGADNPA